MNVDIVEIIPQTLRYLHATSIMADESALTPHQPIYMYVLRLLDTDYVVKHFQAVTPTVNYLCLNRNSFVPYFAGNRTMAVAKPEVIVQQPIQRIGTESK